MTINETIGRPNVTQNYENAVNTVNTAKVNLRDTVFATNKNLEECAVFVNTILKFLSGDEADMPIPSEQGDGFSAYADITRERSYCVLRGLNKIAEALGIDM